MNDLDRIVREMVMANHDHRGELLVYVMVDYEHFSPSEARALAHRLLEVADEVEARTSMGGQDGWSTP